MPSRPRSRLTTIAKLETSKMGLTLDWMNDIARALEVSVHELIDDTVRPKMLPMIGRIAAGGWQEAVEDPEGHMPVLDEGLSGKEFVLRVQGDSMDQLVQDGGWVIVDPADVEMVPGKLYAVRNAAGEATFKRFELDPPRLAPCSTNPTHQPLLIGREPFTVIGRVKRGWSDF